MKAAIEYQRTLSGVVAEVSADVENHYGSIRLDHLQGMLASAGVDDCSSAGLAELLGRLRSIPGLAGGLPVSVEASAPLGTVALIGLDRRLRMAGYWFARWMDDLVLMLRRGQDPVEAHELIAEHLALGGQQLNAEKWRVTDRDLEGAELSMGPGDGPPESFSKLAVLRAAEGMTRSLGLLRHQKSGAGIGTVLQHPWTLDRFPKEVVQYLSVVNDQISPEQWEQFETILGRPTTVTNGGGQLHLAKMFSHLHPLSATAARRVFDMAASLDVHSVGPAKAHMLRAAGSSVEQPTVRSRRAIELADALSDLDLKRGLLSPLMNTGGLNRSTKNGLRYLARCDPDLVPTTEWLLSA